MKVVRITATNNGGAGLCVQRLHDTFIKKGNDESLILQYGEKKDDSVVVAEEDSHIICYTCSGFIPFCYRRLAQFGLLGKTHYYKYQLSKLATKHYFFATLPVSFYKSLSFRREIQEADIINIHWIGDFIDIPTFFRKVNKPIVWSLHDENPARGCLHYDCPNIDYNRLDKILSQKKSKWLKRGNKLHIVVQSKHMADVCKKSQVLSRYPISIINNGVILEQFIMKNKIESKNKLGISTDRIVYLFSSVHIEDERKGLRKLIEALERQKNPKVLLICVGDFKEVPKAGIEIRCMGFVSDTEYYSTIYSAADYFVLASSQESFAKTPLEAMACGTPVIAFPCSGIEDCVTDNTGVICNGFTVDDLHEGIVKASSKRFNGDNLRQHIASNFTFDIMYQKYCKLYNDILSSKLGTQSKNTTYNR